MYYNGRILKEFLLIYMELSSELVKFGLTNSAIFMYVICEPKDASHLATIN